MRDFREALRLLLSEPRRGESPEAAEARKMSGEGRYAEAVGAFSPRQDIEKKVAAYLAEKPEDYLGAFGGYRYSQAADGPVIPVIPLQPDPERGRGRGAATSRLRRRGDNWAEVTVRWSAYGEDPRGEGAVAGEAVALIQLVGYAFRDYGSRFDGLILSISRKRGWSRLRSTSRRPRRSATRGASGTLRSWRREAQSRARTGRHALSFTSARGEYATTLLREVLKPEDPLAAGF